MSVPPSYAFVTCTGTNFRFLPQKENCISELMTNIYVNILFIPRHLDVIDGQYYAQCYAVI